MIDWALYPNFSKKEFDCTHCGANQMTPAFMEKLQALRSIYGKPMRVTSGFRCAQHPIEAKKAKPGAHASGCACDIGVEGREAYQLLRFAFELGFTGIGVNQKAGSRFIHLDTLEGGPRPNVWSY